MHVMDGLSFTIQSETSCVELMPGVEEANKNPRLPD